MTVGWMYRAFASIAICVELTAIAPSDCYAQSGTDNNATEVARNWVKALDRGDLDSLYADFAAPYFVQNVQQVPFTNWVKTLRIQSGGPATARSVEGTQELNQLPNGTTGDFIYIRFRSVHPNAAVFDDVTLQNLNGEWRVYWYAIIPAPPLSQ